MESTLRALVHFESAAGGQKVVACVLTRIILLITVLRVLYKLEKICGYRSS